MEQIAALKDFLGSLKVGRPMTHGMLTLFPVHDGRSPGLSYLLLQEAIATGKLRVNERGGGTVPELLLVNEADRLVFLMDGEELIGAKQNRTLNTSMLVAGKSTITIPVSCVEQGRWAYASRDMKEGSISYPSLRNLKGRDVHQNLKAFGGYHADQGRVWRSVAMKLEAVEVHSPTSSMSEAYSRHEDSIGAYATALPYQAGACGVIAAVAGRLVCADMFDSADTMGKLWVRLVGSYALDAIEAERSDARRRGAAGRAGDRTPTEEAAAALLCLPEDAEVETFPSPGLGTNLRIRHRQRSGHALVHEGRPVHVALFGPEEESPAGTGPLGSFIRRPSQRRV